MRCKKRKADAEVPTSATGQRNLWHGLKYLDDNGHDAKNEAWSMAESLIMWTAAWQAE